MALNPQQASTNELVQVKQIKGLVPALDDKEVGQPFVISGRNFAVDYEGPYAAFAHVFGSYDPIQNPIAIETIQIGNAVFYCTQNAIYTYDSIGMWFVPVYQFTPVTDAWPWSVAYVGSKYYLCREGVGVLQYDPVAISFQNINTMTFTYQGTPGQAVSAFLPVNPCAICQSYGRLVILGTDKVVWSAQDNGIYIGVDLTTGSAYQGLSIIGGSPLNVKETIDGFVTFTTNGILKSEINNGVTVYNHFVLSRTAKMLNPFCCVTMPNAIGTTTSPFLSSSDMIITFLTKQGFYTTDGHVPRPWEPLFSEFLTKKILPNYKDLTVTSLFRLLYVEDRRWLFLSVADPDFQQKYQKAYVLYTPRDEWGSFNELHCAIGLFNVGLSPQQNYNLGYIDWNGYIHTFQDLAYKEMTFDSFHNYLYRVKTEAQCRYIENGVLLASTQMRMAITDESKFGNKISGLYNANNQIVYGPEFPLSNIQDYTDSLIAIVGLTGEDWVAWPAAVEDYLTSLNPNEDWNNGTPWYAPQFMAFIEGYTTISTLPIYKTFVGLDADVQIGLFRFNDNEYSDELGLVTNASVGIFAGTGLAFIEDWSNWVPSFPDVIDDWNIIPSGQADEDWGLSISPNTNYNFNLISTNDGYTAFMTVTPTLAINAGTVQYYTLSSTGIFHTVDISATYPNQSFHLRFLELSGNVAGRL